MNKFLLRSFLLLFILLFIGQLSNVVYGQINTGSPIIPFGSNTVYAGGLLPGNLPTTGAYGKSTDAANAYNTWKTNYTVACGANYRVKFDDPTKTVSEGIGYGMLLAAYAADKALFDGLWGYYKASKNGNGVMDWTINGCSGVGSAGGASDAELDAATALLVAATQWPLATTYQADAVTLINAIQANEMDAANYQVKNGDGWNPSLDCRNPSYHAPAYFRLFAIAVPAQATFWNNAVTAAYTLVNANANSTTGLVSDWSSKTGATNACQTGSTSGQYGYDACRNPWRMATDVAWNGSTTAAAGQTLCNKIATYISGKGATSVGGPVPQAGGSGGHYATFVSTFAAGCVGSTNQAILDQMYSQAVGVSDVYSGASPSGYFGNTLRCVSLFMLTGNFWKPGSSPTQEINVQQNGGNVLSGSIYSLGNIQQGTSINYTFTIQNLGLTALTVGAVSFSGTDASKFSIVTPPAGSVAANSTTTLVIKLTQPATTGPISATMSIVNNDLTGGESPYVINLTATATATATSPAIAVDYKGVSIVSGNAPAYSLGNITTSSAAANATGYYTFTITNTGTAPLSWQTITVAGTGYTVFFKPTMPASVAVGATATFTVAVLANTTAGTQTGTVTLTSTGLPNYVINLTANIVTCATSVTSTLFLDDFEGNINITKSYNPTGLPFNEAATNPSVDATNPSPICMLYTRLATGTYDGIRYHPAAGCATTYNTTIKKGISMLVYSPTPGITIVLSTKTTAGGAIADLKTVTTKTNAWEKIFFDLAPIAGNATVGLMDIQVDPTPAPGVQRTYYFDDIKYEDPACITDLPSSQVFMDYDAHRNLSLLWLYSGTSTLNEATANPSATGLNTSPTVAKFVRQAISSPTVNFTQGWRYVGCQQSFDFSNKTTISMLVYSAKVGIPISMTILDAAGTALVGGSATVNTTVAGAWERLYYDFSALAGMTTGAFMDIAPDPLGANVTPAANLTYYFDDIRYDITPCTAIPTANAGVDASVCSGSTVALSGTVTNATGGKWTGGSGTYSPSSTTAITTYTPSAAEITAGTATLTFISTGIGTGCTSASDAMTITIMPALTPANAGVDQTICVATATLAGNTATSGTGAWSVVTGTATITTPASPTSGVTGLVTGSVTLRWTISGTGCTSSTDDVIITRSAPPTVNAGIDQTICAASLVSVAGTMTGATGVLWSSSGTGTFLSATSLSTTYTPSAAEITAGTSTLTLTSTGGGCTPVSDAMVVTIKASPTLANAGVDQTICAATATLAGNTAASGTGAWTVVTGTATITTPSSATSGVTGLVVGSATLRWTISNAPCTATTDDVIITQTAPPTTSNAGADQTICATTATLAGNTAASGTGTWTLVSGTATITTPSNPTSGVTGLGVGANTLRWTIASTGCTSSTDDVIINVSGGLTASNAGVDQTICAATATLAGNTPTSGTGAWTVVTGTATITTPASPTSGVTGLVTGAVTLRWTISGAGCTASTDDVIITRTATPTTANAGIDQTICATTTTLAGNTAASGTGMWTVVSGTATITTPSSPTSGVTGLGLGANTLRWTISNAPCTASTDDVIINVSGGLTASNAGVDQTICAATATLTGNTPTSGTGAWTVVTGTATITTPTSPTSGVTGLSVGAVTLRWTISGAGCTASTDDVVITRTAAPTTANAGVDQTICATNTTLAGNTAASGTGMWTVVSGTATITTPSSPTSGVTGLGVGANTLRWTISNAPCTASTDDVIINVSGGLTASNAGVDQTICAATATLAGNTPTSGTGAWTVVTGTATITTPTSPTSGVTGLVTGAVTLRWTISGAGCTSSTDDVVITRSAPATVNAGPDQSVCMSAAINLSGSVSGATGASWSTAGGGTFGNATSLATTYTPSASENTAGTATLTLTSTGGGCTPVSDNVVITINATSAAVGVSIAGPANLCAGTSLTFTATPTGGFGTPTYAWFVNNTSTGTNSPSYTSTGLFGGDQVTCKMTSSLSCAAGSPATSNTLTVIAAGTSPCGTGTLIIQGPLTPNANQTPVSYDVANFAPNTTYHWSLPPGTVILSANADSSQVVLAMGSTNGNITVTGTDNTSGNVVSTGTAVLNINGASGISHGSAGSDSYIAYPTPFTNEAVIRINSTLNTSINIRVVDSKGVTMFTTEDYATNQDISLGKDLAGGVYLVQVTYQNRIQVIKLVKI